MSDYFVVLSNLSSIPCIIYYQYQKKYYYSLQILLTSFFSFMHHLNTSGVYSINDNGLFDFLDGLYSYWSIFIFSLYLFLSNHNELIIERSIVLTSLIAFVYMNLSSIILLPIIVFIILFITGLHHNNINKLSLYNKYLYIVILLCCIDIGCFFAAVQTNYNYFHSAHHLVSFNIPIFIDRYILAIN